MPFLHRTLIKELNRHWTSRERSPFEELLETNIFQRMPGTKVHLRFFLRQKTFESSLTTEDLLKVEDKEDRGRF